MREYESAIWAIPADDRDVWIRVGMALKAEVGEDGWHLFDEWSSGGLGYKQKDARAAWRSFPVSGKVGIATLYYLARECGWTGSAGRPEVDPARLAERRRRAEQEEADLRRNAEAVAQQAEGMLRSCRRGWHPYLVAKGFPGHDGFLFSGAVQFTYGMRQFSDALLLPIRRIDSGRLVSAELIDADGKKLFLPGGRRTGSGVRLCDGPRVVMCEGYATGLSVQLALRRMCIRAEVICVLSASSYASAAALKAPWLVVADRDDNGVGERSARAVCDLVAVPDVGDANDLHASKGLAAVCELIRSAIRPVADLHAPTATA